MASANCSLGLAPHLGRRQITITTQRTGVDFAHALRDLVDGAFPAAERIVLVLDNLNTHRPAALYQAFPPAEARRILERIEWHFTPTHGSWLNIAELEWAVLMRQCLDRRIPTQEVWRRRSRPGWRGAIAPLSASPGASASTMRAEAGPCLSHSR